MVLKSVFIPVKACGIQAYEHPLPRQFRGGGGETEQFLNKLALILCSPFYKEGLFPLPVISNIVLIVQTQSFGTILQGGTVISSVLSLLNYCNSSRNKEEK